MARRRRTTKKKQSARAGSGGRFVVLLKILLLCVVLAAGAGVGTLAWLWPRCEGEQCPSVAALRDFSPAQASRVFDDQGRLFAFLAPERRIVVPLDQVPPRVIGAFLAVEDKRFFQHHGIDYRRLVGALVRDLQTLSYQQGFSTLTMQLARNVFPEHLTRQKTIRRKLWEVMLAREIEQTFSKAEILEMYLNQIYLGDGFYGVEAAARGYFGKPARELSTAEAATLAALPRSPTFYNPRRNAEAAIRRRNLVLGLMAGSGVIAPAEAAVARAQPLELAPPPEARGAAPYVVAEVRRQLREHFGPEADVAGLRVYTTVDLELQRTAEQALREQIHAIEAGKMGRYGRTSCAGARAEDPAACLQGMFVAIDPATGNVKAMVGGRDFGLSQFNRVTQARRQAGSAFKPLVYAAALEAGIPLTTALIGPGADAYTAAYNPADHVTDSLTVDLREGLRTSSNRAAVVLGDRVGADAVVKTARDLGLSTPIQPYPSTFLGAADVVPLELVTAYTAFANHGAVAEPRLIRRVEDARGKLVWDVPARNRQALPPGVAFLTLDLMRDVVDRGTGAPVRAAGLPYNIPAAGKTGTTNDVTDVWFVGATPDLVAGVWLGFDDPARIVRGGSGGSLAAPVWGRVMKNFYSTRPAPAAWVPPPDVVSVFVDRLSGLRATSACPGEYVESELFVAGTEPVAHCPLHPEGGVGGWFRRTLRDFGGWLEREEPAPAPAPMEPRRPPQRQGTGNGN